MKLVALALTALALAACASTSTTTAGPGSARSTLEEKEYRTGSRIPVRSAVVSSPAVTPDPSAPGAGAAPRAN